MTFHSQSPENDAVTHPILHMDAVASFGQRICLERRLPSRCDGAVVANIGDQIVPELTQPPSNRKYSQSIIRCDIQMHVLGQGLLDFQHLVNQLRLLNASLLAQLLVS